jgi:hypothetical protein
MDNGSLEALRSLRDIKGIQGSFVVRAGSGELLGRDLPAVIDDAVLADVGPRIDRLLTIVESPSPTDALALHFGEQRLDVKRMGAAHLCVLAEAAVSPPALRMAMKLVGRKLDGHAWGAPPLPKAALAPATPATPATVEPPKRTVQFRGRQTTI